MEQTQIEAQDFQHRPAQNDRVANQSPESQDPRKQPRPVKQVIQHQPSDSNRDHAEMVSILLGLP